jgi:archaeosine-15-forming tRNA-guanine transglycosylase
MELQLQLNGAQQHQKYSSQNTLRVVVFNKALEIANTGRQLIYQFIPLKAIKWCRDLVSWF